MKMLAGLKLYLRKPRHAPERPQANDPANQEECGDGRHACGHSIHVVEQVHGVRDGDEPEDADECVHGVPIRQRHDSVEHDQDGAAHYLHDELQVRLEIQHIVEKADHEHEASGEDDAYGDPVRGNVGRDVTGHAGDDHGERRRGACRRRDADATE
jgi:hypothetical protein